MTLKFLYFSSQNLTVMRMTVFRWGLCFRILFFFFFFYFSLRKKIIRASLQLCQDDESFVPGGVYLRPKPLPLFSNTLLKWTLLLIYSYMYLFIGLFGYWRIIIFRLILLLAFLIFSSLWKILSYCVDRTGHVFNCVKSKLLNNLYFL